MTTKQQKACRQTGLIGVYLLVILNAIFPLEVFAKIKTYSLPELIAQSDVIVVSEIKVENSKSRAVVQRTLKGESVKNFLIRASFEDNSNELEFKDGEIVILFAGKEENGGRTLIGDGDQGKWPKTVEKWPYSKIDIVPLSEVESVVKQILILLSEKDLKNIVKQINEMLLSENPFRQYNTLYYLLLSADKNVITLVGPAVEKMASSNNSDISNVAQIVKNL